MDKGTIVSLEKVSKSYGDISALVEVSLAIGPGITGLLGPNGAGKTTLIKVLLGLVRVSAGRGDVLGYPIGQDIYAIRRHVGYMPEDDCYLPGLTGVETLQLGARLSGLPSREALRRAHEILDFCGIKEERYRPTAAYSLGMRQKLKFALAIVHDPEFLILDEPTSGLDPMEREEMLSRVRVLAQKFGKAVLLSTHILPDVQAICDWVVILARGRVRVSESVEVLNRPSQPAYWVQTLGPVQPLAQWAQSESLPVEIMDDHRLCIHSAELEVVQRLWRGAHECGAVIRQFQPAKNSLETIFLEAFGDAHHADS